MDWKNASSSAVINNPVSILFRFASPLPYRLARFRHTFRMDGAGEKFSSSLTMSDCSLHSRVCVEFTLLPEGDENF